MFTGVYNHNLDEKGRVIMPMKFREELGFTFFITRGLDGCLFAFPEKEWEKFSQDLLASNAKDKNTRKIQRFFLAPCTECSLDKQGRVLLSSSLREYAKLDKNIVIVGLKNKLEIWSKDKWDEYDSDDADIEDIMQDMDGLNI